MGGKAHHPSSSDSDYWGDESWTVDCPCGVSFDDGEEMVECDECGVWVHTACCRVPKGLSTFVCDKCKSKKKKESEEVTEVSHPPPSEPSCVDIHAPDPVHKPNEVPISDRVHVQGPPGGDAHMFVEVSRVFSQQLWRFTGYIPKAFHPKCSDLPSWPYQDDIPERLLSTMLGKEVLFASKEGAKFLERPTDEDPGNMKKENAVFPHTEKHGKRDAKKVEGKHSSKLGQKPRASRDGKVQLHIKRGCEEAVRKDPSSKRIRVGSGLKEEEPSKEDEVSQRSEVEPTLTKSPVFSTKNPKAMKKMAVQEFMDGHVSICSRCTHSEQNAN